jgi:GTP-binding protein
MIVDSVSGVTVTETTEKVKWKEFSVIDTGGYIRGSDDVFEGEIRKQVELAIDEADVIIFVVDVEEESRQWMMLSQDYA